MGMMRQCRTPGVQHHGDTDARAEVLGIGGDRAQGFGGRLEQQVIDHGFVLISEVADRCRQCEHRMEILDGQQLGLACGKPTLCRRGLALRAMPITTRVVGDLRVLTIGTAQHVTAEFGAPTALDGAHDFELAKTEPAALLQSKGITAGAENIRDLQGGARHADDSVGGQ